MTRRNSEFVVHDGWQIALTLDAKGNVKNRNLWGANQDELIATNGQFTLCDHLGSVRDIVDAGGNVLNHIEYNAFGKVTKQTGKSDCVFGYTGKMFDDATGLQWNINRWYDAGVGRWISEDPIGFRGKDANLVRYVKNSPITSYDPTGLVTVVNSPIGVLCGPVGGTKTVTRPFEHENCDGTVPKPVTHSQTESMTINVGGNVGGSAGGVSGGVSITVTIGVTIGPINLPPGREGTLTFNFDCTCRRAFRCAIFAVNPLLALHAVRWCGVLSCVFRNTTWSDNPC